MRVIGGELRSRRLVSPAGMATRPTSDRLRETLFNVLGARIAGARFLDLFAGSGAVGIEALSRGAARCLAVEYAPAALKALRTNAEALGLAGRLQVESRPVAKALADLRARGLLFDLVFLDPPYAAGADYADTLRRLGDGAPLAPGAWVVAEHARRDTLPPAYARLRRFRLLEQGDAALSFYALEELPPEAGLARPEAG